MTRNINAPLPAPSTHRPHEWHSAVWHIGNLYQYESSGIFKQNQLIANFNVRGGKRLSLFTTYADYAMETPEGFNVSDQSIQSQHELWPDAV